MEELNGITHNAKRMKLGKVGVVLMVFNALTALSLSAGFLLFWNFVGIPAISFDPADLIFSSSSAAFSKNIILAFGIPAAMCMLAPAVMLLSAAIAAIRKSGRGWRWAVWGHGLTLTASIISLYYALDLFSIGGEHQTHLIEMLCLVVWTAILLVGNLALSRRRSAGKPRRIIKPIFIILLCLQLLFIMGGHRVGTMLLLDNPSLQHDCLRGVISDKVIKMKEDWGDIKTREVQFRPYDNTVLSYSFRMPVSAKREEEQDNACIWFRINGNDDELIIVIFPDRNLDPNSMDYDPNKGAMSGGLDEMNGINIFGDVTDLFERLKITRNASPDGFSLLSSHNDNFRLFALLEIKQLMIPIGDFPEPEKDGYHIYQTTCLKSIRGILSKQTSSDWIDSKGRSLLIITNASEGADETTRELTPDEIKLINNIAASIRINETP